MQINNPSNTSASDFLTLLSSTKMVQHVNLPTHCHNYMLDIITISSRTTMAKSRSFSVAGPSLWNHFPPSACTSFLSSNLSTSLSLLKTCLFSWSQSNQRRLCWPTPLRGATQILEYDTISLNTLTGGMSYLACFFWYMKTWLRGLSPLDDSPLNVKVYVHGVF